METTIPLWLCVILVLVATSLGSVMGADHTKKRIARLFGAQTFKLPRNRTHYSQIIFDYPHQKVAVYLTGTSAINAQTIFDQIEGVEHFGRTLTVKVVESKIPFRVR